MACRSLRNLSDLVPYRRPPPAPRLARLGIRFRVIVTVISIQDGPQSQQRFSWEWYPRCTSYHGGNMAKKGNERERIDTGTDARYVRRDEDGKFKESDDVGRSLSQDQRRDAENEVKKGQGDRGDRRD